MKEKIIIIGSGNISWHLNKEFAQYDMPAINIPARRFLEGDINQYKEELGKGSIIIIAVIDSGISSIANKLYQENLLQNNAIITHTSGSTSIDVLKNNKYDYGVFYPLQTFTKGIDVDFKTIPICIEGNKNDVEERLKNLASIISSKLYRLSSLQRKKLHIAAVFSCNFVNHLLGIAKQELEKEDIGFDLLFPLIDQTIEKAKANSPFEVQTGPAIRNDEAIMNWHIEDLEEEEKELYKVLSRSIINKHR